MSQRTSNNLQIVPSQDRATCQCRPVEAECPAGGSGGSAIGGAAGSRQIPSGAGPPHVVYSLK